MRSIPTLVLTIVACVASQIARPAARAETISLPQAIDRALRFAPAVAQAAAGSDLSEAQLRETRAPLLPEISGQGEYTQSPGYDPTITNRGQTDALLMLNYTAYDFGRRAAQVRAARYASEAARLGIAAERAQIAFDTKLAYFGLLRSLHARRELERSLDRLTRYVATIGALVQSGRAIANDQLKIEVARDDHELAMAAAQSDYDSAEAVLSSMIGEWGRRDLSPVEADVIAPPPGGELSRNPALIAAMNQVQSAVLDQRAAEAERYPTFKIALNAGFLGIDPSNTFEHRAGASYDGLLSVPIFSGGAITARIDQARALVREARAAQRQTELDLLRRLADASLRYRQARRALEILSREQPTADDAFALSWARFLGGGGATMLEVLDAYQQAEKIRIDRTGQEFVAQQAAAEGALALGLAE